MTTMTISSQTSELSEPAMSDMVNPSIHWMRLDGPRCCSIYNGPQFPLAVVLVDSARLIGRLSVATSAGRQKAHTPGPIAG
jgi:hypothetical protein